ncbi:diadenosine tetraphosphatase [Moraxella caprae]|uniref:Diadenosine tetraphosphatase n=1 Tax=Moraxella caprae TaxID=90240 RepID=A0A378R3D3_9GAMM|nr:metallophosphoesterase [Moraxella caprae]STZ09528.1 diadenosine tetraphosphatase [Moraxella caprae]
MARVFAIGDIHGSKVALATLIDGIQPIFDDTLIFLGDYVNRGDDSKGVLDILMNFLTFVKRSLSWVITS